MRKAIYVAATRQHVGKSSVCLGMMSSLIDRFNPGNVGFIKPVGQRHTTDKLTGEKIDNDVHTTVEYFNMKPTPNLKAMSPIIFDRTHTRDVWSNGGLNNRTVLREKKQTIIKAFDEVCQSHDFTIVEGTGHTGVGSCVGLNNAQVASMLNLDMIFIANGGLGRTYDELALNIGLAKLEGASIGGVVINKVQKNKLKQVQDFFEPVLDQWNIPLVGIVPYEEALDSPTMRDYEELFGVERLSGKNHNTHYKDVQIVATGLRRFLEKLASGLYDESIFVTHASRADVVLGYLSHCKLYQLEHDKPFPGGLLVCGEATDKPGGGTIDENKHLIKAIRAAAITDPSVGILFVNRAVRLIEIDITQHCIF
jgi:BioD-like phosphotransacetylase family protein